MLHSLALVKKRKQLTLHLSVSHQLGSSMRNYNQWSHLNSHAGHSCENFSSGQWSSANGEVRKRLDRAVRYG